ncbi:putative ribonuclease H-like domain-containing protein [Tanacetum coccineum]
MTSFDCRLKAIKACSACGNLHTSAFCCSKEKLKNKILVPMPESSQQHIKIERICFDCGDLLHGLNCLECDLTRKILEKAFQKFQNTSKSSNDNSNVVNAPREPFVVKQDPSVNSSQKSPLIDQKCCCECGDSLDGIFCQRCTSLILGDLKSAVQTRSKVDAMPEELLQFKIQKVWILIDLPYGKKAIGTKWVYRNKKDERGVVVRNKASAFLYGKIDEKVYVSQPPGFIDHKYPKKVYKVVKALYGLHQALRAWYATLSTFLLKNGHRRGTIDKTLFIKKDKHDIILVQVYMDDIIFGLTKKSWCDEFEALMKNKFQMSSMGELTFFLGLQTASTPIETHKPLVKDEEASDVDVYLYRSMIGSLMYLTASRPDIMYLKGKPKLGLWYPRVSSFDLEAYSDSDYAGANLDRKSTTGGCQFLGRRLISWKCKKQTIMATSTAEAEYVAAANCCGQVLWIQNQMLDYSYLGFKESLGRALDGTEALQLPKMFILWLAKVSTDSANLVPLSKDSTAIETLKKIPPRSFMRLLIFLHEAPFTMLLLYITAKVAGKPVSIFETSIRSDLLFDDADEIDSLPNQAIFNVIQLMGHLDAKKKFVMFPRFISIFLDKQLKNVPVPLDHFPVNALTSKVFSFMVKKGKHFSGKVTPLFSNMLVQPTKDKGEQSERPSKPQPTPSPPYPKDSGRNQGGQSSSDRSLSGNKGSMTLQSVYDLCISLCTQGRKSAKAEPSVHKDPLFDELDDDEINNMETEYAQGIGRTRYMVHEEKERKEKEVSTEDALGIDKQKDSTDRPDKRTDDQTKGRNDPQTPPTTTTLIIFGDDETIAQVLLNMSQAKSLLREKEKEVELKDVEETERPRPTSTRSLLILKPLLKIDPKDKRKKKIEEEHKSDTESEKEERKRLAEEEATNAALIQDFDDIKARMEADRLLALRLQEEERSVHYGRESKIPS